MKSVASETTFPIKDLQSAKDLRAKTKNKKRLIRVERLGDDLVLREGRGPIAAHFAFCGFLLLWWSFWSVGCAALLGWIVRQPTLEHILFAVPFFDAWFFALLILSAGFFGRTALRLGPRGLLYEWSIFGQGARRRVPIDELRGVSEYSQVTDLESGKIAHGVKITTDGSSIRLAFGANDDERAELIALLDAKLKDLRSDLDSLEKPAAAWKAKRPSDSEFGLTFDWDHTVLVRRYRIRPGSLAGLTFLNLFWNGIVAVFLLQLTKQFFWSLFLFLIPFEFIGAVILAALVGELLSPFRSREWSLRPDAMTDRASLGILCRARIHDPMFLDHVELRKGVQAKKWVRVHRLPPDAEDHAFALGFVDGDGRDMFVIDDLTEGKARWLQDEIGPLIKNHFYNRMTGTIPSDVDGSLWDRWTDGSPSIDRGFR